MIHSNPLHRPALTEERLRELEGLIFCEKFISLERAVSFDDKLPPFESFEDRFIEYDWKTDRPFINYLIRIGELTGNPIVFKQDALGAVRNHYGDIILKRSRLKRIGL